MCHRRSWLQQHTHRSIYTCIFIYIYIYIYIFMYVYVCVYIYIYTHPSLPQSVGGLVVESIYMSLGLALYLHIYIYIHTYIYIYIYIHTYTDRQIFVCVCHKILGLSLIHVHVCVSRRGILLFAGRLSVVNELCIIWRAKEVLMEIWVYGLGCWV